MGGTEALVMGDFSERAFCGAHLTPPWKRIGRLSSRGVGALLSVTRLDQNWWGGIGLGSFFIGQYLRGRSSNHDRSQLVSPYDSLRTMAFLDLQPV